VKAQNKKCNRSFSFFSSKKTFKNR